MVRMNRPTHHIGSGLFISVRSSSHTWPVVLSLRAATFLRAVTHSRIRQPAMLAMVRTATYCDQKPLMKSLTWEAPSVLFERDAAGFLEAVAPRARPGPGADAEEGQEGSHGGDLAQEGDVHVVLLTSGTCPAIAGRQRVRPSRSCP